MDELDAENQKIRDALLQKESALAAREAAFETRESKYVRRDLLKDIKKEIADQFTDSLPKDTYKKRWPIHGICLSCLIAAGIGAGYLIRSIGSATNIDWHLLLPLSGCMFLFVGTIVFYIKWNDQWFREHAESNFRNKRFAADMLRASWIAEMMFAWEDKGSDKEFPSILLESFTKNLFREDKMKATDHPADTVGKVASQLETVRFGSGGGEVMFGTNRSKVKGK